MELFKRILCPVDFSRISSAAIELAVKLALDHQATVLLLCAAPPPDANQSRAEIERAAQGQLLAVARRWFEGRVPFEVVVREGDASSTILQAQQELAVDCVVMATHGRVGEDYAKLGSVTERVVRESACPVVTIRPRTAN